jgi:hypothetical protein
MYREVVMLVRVRCPDNYVIDGLAVGDNTGRAIRPVWLNIFWSAVDKVDRWL